MKKVFIIHGFEGSPNSAWIPWLMSELKTLGIYASSLTMPTPNEPQKVEWVEEIRRCIDKSPEDEIFLVGHSLGCAGILNYLQSEGSKKVCGTILVSGRCQKSNNPKIEEFYTSFDFKKIKSMSESFIVIHGDKDDFVPVENADILSEKLNVEPIIVKDAGHFTTGEGWRSMPLVLEKLKDILENK